VGKEKISYMCPKSAFPITLGCAYRKPEKGKYGECWIIMATDDIINAAGWTKEIVKRHEVAHGQRTIAARAQ